MKTVILDTSVWVAYTHLSDSFSYEAQRIVARKLARGYNIIVPPPVIIELINVLSKNNISIEKIKKDLTLLRHIKNISIPNVDHDLLFDAAGELAGKVKLRSQDFYIIVYAYLIKVDEFITFDRAQKTSYDYIKKTLIKKV